MDNKITITLRLPKDLIEYVERKKEQMLKEGLSKKEVSNQSVIEALVAYCKEIEDVSK